MAASSASSSSTAARGSKEEEAPMAPFNCRSVQCFEKLNKLGEGTYGTVFRARDKQSGRIVALKKVKLVMNNGFPLTSVREIKLLMTLNHPNIVKLLEVVVGNKPSSIFLVFEYCEHDFAALLERMQNRRWSLSEVKCIMLQLLSGLEYLHSNFILHRDLKLSNLLMNNKGELKLADFGLARVFGNPLEPYTPKVITLWYRAPEILLGAAKYHTAVDMWAMGCIFGELLLHKPLLPGNTELKQLELIFKLLGNPTAKIAPTREWKLYHEYMPKLPECKYNTLKDEFPKLSDNGLDLLSRLLTYDPSKRITAEKALQHPFFTEHPLPKEAHMMPTFPASNEEAETAAAAAAAMSRRVKSLGGSSKFTGAGAGVSVGSMKDDNERVLKRPKRQ